MAVQEFEGTRVDEISDGIFRISTLVASIAGGGITYNQYLLVDDEPLLFHTGKRRMFSQVQEAVARVLPLERLPAIPISGSASSRPMPAFYRSRRTPSTGPSRCWCCNLSRMRLARWLRCVASSGQAAR